MRQQVSSSLLACPTGGGQRQRQRQRKIIIDLWPHTGVLWIAHHKVDGNDASLDDGNVSRPAGMLSVIIIQSG